MKESRASRSPAADYVCRSRKASHGFYPTWKLTCLQLSLSRHQCHAYFAGANKPRLRGSAGTALRLRRTLIRMHQLWQ